MVTTTNSSTNGSEEGGHNGGPMDLSSAGAAAAGAVGEPASPPQLGPPPSLLEDHPLLNARKLAEFVKAQHLAQQQKENETTPPSNSLESKLPKKRHWPNNEDFR